MSLLILSVLAAQLSSAADSITSAKLTRAAYLINNRHLSPVSLDSAQKLLVSVRELEPENELCLSLLSQLNLTLGDNAGSRSESLSHYLQAAAIADTLRQLNGANPEGHLWWAAGQGSAGRIQGILSSLWMLPSIKHELELSLQLDSACEPAYTGLGILWREVPSFAGGSLTRSRQYFLSGLSRYPNATDLRIELARTDIALGRKDEALAQLDSLLDTNDPLDPGRFQLGDLPAALKLKDRLSGH